MRLDKFLSHTGIGSRKEAKEALKKRRVKLNGSIIKDGKMMINPSMDVVEIDGIHIVYQRHYYYMLNKPKGVITATEDREHRTVIDLLAREDQRPGLFPVGRLDKDTTGLLLLTTDGQLGHQLLSPKKKVPKQYIAQVEGVMTEADVILFREGIVLSTGEVCLPATLKINEMDLERQTSQITLEIVEGKYHQVKRMVEAVGKKVVELERVSMGGLELDSSLFKGHYRELTEAEHMILAPFKSEA